jgi:hypothetical protein
MPKSSPSVEKALTRLQGLARRPTTASGRPAMRIGVPEDLRRPGIDTLLLSPGERDAFETAHTALGQDLRFEHLRPDSATDALRRFVCLSFLERRVDHVAGFVQEHARELMQRTCFFPVDDLSVEAKTDLFGVRLLPGVAVSPPPAAFWPTIDVGSRAVVAVGCAGTSHDQMALRARDVAERALRCLRAALREDRWTLDSQLRFRLGRERWFDDGAWGLSSHPGRASELELDARALKQLALHEFARLPVVPETDVERRAERALQWFEQSQLAVDPLQELLYLFFALEAILGDRSEALKASKLAIRRAMLGLAVRGSFAHPARAYILYDEVRSAAVHGEQPPRISSKEVDAFAWDVRCAIREFFSYAREQGFAKRAEVRSALEADSRRTEIESSLMAEDSRLWGKILGERAG